MMRLFLIGCFCSFVSLANAQEPRFIEHNIGDEHAGVPINTMLQDHQGMIWFGTDQGLVRYDGIAWRPVSMDSSAIPGKVTSLFEDREGKIWVGTAIGQIYYLDIGRRIHFFDIDEGHPAKSITAILQDKSGQIWFASYGEGIYIYTGNRLFNMNKDDGLAANDIYDMSLAPSGEIWVATDDGINICSFANELKTITHLGLEEGLPDQIITTLETDRHGNIWIGTFEHGLVCYNASQKKIIAPFDSKRMGEITSIEIFDGVEIWIGTRKTGLWKYHPNAGFPRRVLSLSAISEGEISDLMTDVEGNIWVTMWDGILISAFRPFESLSIQVGEIQSLFCDKRDQVWIGSKAGLYRLKENSHTFSSAIRELPQYDLNITDIIEDNFNNLWIGTLDMGLYIFQTTTGKVKQIKADKLKDNTIMSMATAKKRIWVASLQGVISYGTNENIFEDENVKFDVVDDPWQSRLNFVYQVFVDTKDRAWFGTDGKGVYCIANGTVTQYRGNDSVELRSVYSICEDNRGHLWFNTPDIGLVEFDGTDYIPLGIREGLGNLNISSIALTGVGDLIISHNRGIDLMEPERRHFMYYADQVGVKEIDPGFNSISTNSKGHVYISGRDIIVKYYSAQNELSIHPRTLFTRISVFEEPIDYTSMNTFTRNENYITFDYVGLWYSSPSAVNYQYKLEGYDRLWKQSRDNSASYSSLPPGDYTFSVMASENKFFLDEPMTTYSFTIGKPFWLQNWFIVSTLLFGGLILYMIVKARERRSERQALVQKDMIESQLQALKAQINPHFLFNSFNTLITIIDENADNPDIAIEYVEKLSDFFRSILQYREQETITLAEEWELAQNFGYLLQKRYGPNLRLHMDTPPKDAFILPLTLQMLVENAVKHNVITEKKPLDVYISAYDHDYVIVRNNMQPKSKTEPSTQFGLQSIVKRYQHMSDKKVIIEKDEHYFKVLIPILKSTT